MIPLSEIGDLAPGGLQAAVPFLGSVTATAVFEDAPHCADSESFPLLSSKHVSAPVLGSI